MKLETQAIAPQAPAFPKFETSLPEQKLGWSAMSHFAETKPEPTMSLGWSAMPSFGESSMFSGDAELVANFVRTTRLAESTPSMLATFWSQMSLLSVNP